MWQDVIGDDARRFNGMYRRLDRQARECRIDFRDRVQPHKSPILPRDDTHQRRPGLRVVRMALLGGGNQNCRIEENIQFWLCFQSRLNPLRAYVVKDALPVCPRFWAPLMDPQTIDFDHGRSLFDPLEKHALRLLNSLQLHVRFEAKPFAESFGDDNPPRFVDPKFHTINNTVYTIQNGKLQLNRLASIPNRSTSVPRVPAMKHSLSNVGIFPVENFRDNPALYRH